MGRIVVMVLVAANLLYFGWSYLIGGRSASLTAPAASPPPATVAVPPPPPPCATVGPFTDALLTEQAVKALTDAGWGVMRREATEEIHEGWWVYVPGTSAEQQARTLAALRRAGMRDAFAMPDDTEFRVSIGIFSEENRAEDRAAQVQKLKLDALVTERHREQVAVWFDVPGVARETLADGRLAGTGLPLEKLRIEACPAKADAGAAEAETEAAGSATPATVTP